MDYLKSLSWFDLKPCNDNGNLGMHKGLPKKLMSAG
jgi:hypothetical protein